MIKGADYGRHFVFIDIFYLVLSMAKGIHCAKPMSLSWPIILDDMARPSLLDAWQTRWAWSIGVTCHDDGCKLYIYVLYVPVRPSSLLFLIVANPNSSVLVRATPESSDESCLFLVRAEANIKQLDDKMQDWTTEETFPSPKVYRSCTIGNNLSRPVWNNTNSKEITFIKNTSLKSRQFNNEGRKWQSEMTTITSTARTSRKLT